MEDDNDIGKNIGEFLVNSYISDKKDRRTFAICMGMIIAFFVFFFELFF